MVLKKVTNCITAGQDTRPSSYRRLFSRVYSQRKQRRGEVTLTTGCLARIFVRSHHQAHRYQPRRPSCVQAGGGDAVLSAAGGFRGLLQVSRHPQPPPAPLRPPPTPGSPHHPHSSPLVACLSLDPPQFGSCEVRRRVRRP